MNLDEAINMRNAFKSDKIKSRIIRKGSKGSILQNLSVDNSYSNSKLFSNLLEIKARANFKDIRSIKSKDILQSRNCVNEKLGTIQALENSKSFNWQSRVSSQKLPLFTLKFPDKNKSKNKNPCSCHAIRTKLKLIYQKSFVEKKSESIARTLKKYFNKKEFENMFIKNVVNKYKKKSDNLNFNDKLEIESLICFSKIIKKDPTSIHDKDLINNEALKAHFDSLGFKGILAKRISDYFLKRCNNPCFGSYFRFLNQSLLSDSQDASKQITFNILDIGNANRIYKEDLFNWAKDNSSYFILIYDLISLYKIISLKNSSNYIFHSRIQEFKPPVFVHGNKLWEFVKKQATFRFPKRRKKMNLSWIDPIISSNQRDKIETNFEKIQKSSNSYFAQDGYCNYEDFSKFKFDKKGNPDVLFILIYFLYGPLVCNLVLKNFGLKKIKYLYDKKIEALSCNFEKSELRSFKPSDDYPFLISVAKSLDPKVTMEEIEKRIEKFFKFVDFECGLPSIITEKSFQNSEICIFGHKAPLLTKSLFDLIDTNKTKQITFLKFFEFYELFVSTLTPKIKNQIAYQLYDYNKDGLITSSDLIAFQATGDSTLEFLKKEYTLMYEYLYIETRKSSVRFVKYIDNKTFEQFTNQYSILLTKLDQFFN